MKIISLKEDNYTLYIHEEDSKYFYTKDKKELAKYFKELLQTLKHKYKIDMHGYYELNIYLDINYGMMIDMIKVSDDYFDLFQNKVDVRIIYHKDKNALFEVLDDEILSYLASDSYKLYTYQNKLYLLLLQKIKKNKRYLLLEYTNIIYGDEKDEILNDAKMIFYNCRK